MRITGVGVLLLGLFAVQPGIAEIYRCDVAGKQIFTDIPCEGGEQVELGSTNTIRRVEERLSPAGSAVYSSDAWYEGTSGYHSAERVAKVQNAPMIVYFRTSWCAFCRAVEKNLFPNSIAVQAMRSFVKVRINPESGASERTLFEKMNGRGYPTFLVKTPGGVSRRISITRKPSGDNPHRNISALKFARKLQPYAPRKASEQSLGSARAYSDRARKRFAQKHFGPAMDDIRRAIALQPRSIEHYQFLTEIAGTAGDWDRAVRFWDQYIELVPGDPRGLVGRAGALEGAGRLEEAQRDRKLAPGAGGEEERGRKNEA